MTAGTRWTTWFSRCSRTARSTISSATSGPGDGKTVDGVIGKDLSNRIPEWAEHGAERRTVPYRVAADMDAPNPDSDEECHHTNVQLLNSVALA